MLICPADSCTGCSACYSVCKQNAITMVQDWDGFYYPVIDEKLCVHCKRCESICPIHSVKEKSDGLSPSAIAANNVNLKERMVSSSGGIFSLLAHHILENGGVVFGAAFDETFQVHHICIEKEEDLSLLRGSKYLQSRIENTYVQAKDFLHSGRLVLYTGTPCQIEGLLSFLGKKYSNLYTQDLICHGVPSPLVWKRYVQFRDKAACSKARRIFFRYKKYGWKKYSVSFGFTNETEYIQPLNEDLYMKSFLRNYSLRRSCYDCKFKKINRLSDITLADFWGIQDVAPEMDDDQGTSLVIIHSEKGKTLWDAVKKNTVFQEVDLHSSLRGNPSMTESVKMPERRERFLRAVRYMRFDKCVRKYIDAPRKKKKTLKQWLRSVKRRFF